MFVSLNILRQFILSFRNKFQDTCVNKINARNIWRHLILDVQHAACSLQWILQQPVIH